MFPTPARQRQHLDYLVALASAMDTAGNYDHAEIGRILLRATVSLCTLWQQEGKGAVAHTRLAAIYAWFTEGFNIPDLQAAHALLDALG